jgi:outer membrane protein OmpA-like peptidoglycan-associated protein
LEDTVERQASAKEDIRRDDEEPKNPDVEIAATKPEQEPEPEAPKQVLQPVTLIVNLEDYETGEPLEASVRLRRASDNVVVGIKKLATGIYQMQVTEEKETEYMLSAEKNGYMFKNFKMKLPAAQANPLEIKRNIEMERLTTGYQSVLRNIYFDFDKATFKVNSYDELNKLEQLMAVNEKTQIEISGHTDNIGKKNYNLWLSRKRANAVVEYLVNKGIDERRLIVKGYGDTKPLASNDNEIDGRALNRRVEFKIIGDFNPAMGKSDE